MEYNKNMMNVTENNNKLLLIKFLFTELFTKEFQPEKKLPSTEWLSVKFKLTKPIIRSVLKQFQSIGWIESKYKSGYFVSRKIQSFFFFNYVLGNKTYKEEIIENNIIQDDVCYFVKRIYDKEKPIIDVHMIYKKDATNVCHIDQPLIVTMIHQNRIPTTIEEYISVENNNGKLRIVEIYRYQDAFGNLIAVEEYMIEPEYYHKEIYTSFR